MNIELNALEFNQLKDRIICSITVGSTLYGLRTPKSDHDKLHIYLPEVEPATFHQLIYRENKTDHLLCTLRQFISNIISGDCLINFEALHSEEFSHSQELKFLYEHRREFYTFNLIRAYLGFARRDLKNYDETQNNSKLFHAFRCKLVAQRLLDGQDYENNYQSFPAIDQNLLFKLKHQTLVPEHKNNFAALLKGEIESLRKKLSERLDEHEVSQTISEEFKIKLEDWLSCFLKEKFVGDYQKSAQTTTH